MTHDSNERDEIVSAYLDGEATAEERARIESDPELLARSAQLRAASLRVSEPTSPPVDLDSLVSQALAQAELPPGNVVAMQPRRVRRQRILAAAAVAAAAVVALPLLAVQLLSDRTGTQSEEVARVVLEADDPPAGESFDELADRAQPDAGGQVSEGPSATASDGDPTVLAAPSTTTPPTTGALPDDAILAGELGEFEAAAELVSAVQTALQGGHSRSAGDDEAPAGDASGSVVECVAELMMADGELDGLSLVASATYQGSPITVLSFSIRPEITNANGTQRIIGVSQGCAIVVSRTI